MADHRRTLLVSARPGWALVAGSLLPVACASAPASKGEIVPTATSVTIASALPPPAETAMTSSQPQAPVPAFSLLFQGYAGVDFDLVGPSVMIRHFNVGWS